MSTKPEDTDNGDIPCACLGGTSWHAGDAIGPGSQTDILSGRVDVSRGWADVLSMSNHAETAVLGHRDSGGTYLGIGDMKGDVKETDGVGSHTDTLNGSMDIPSIETDTNRPANAPDSVRTTQKKAKPPDLPSRSTKQHSDKPSSCGNQSDTLNVHADMHSIRNDMGTAENKMKNVRMCRIEQKMLNSPETTKNRMPKSTRRWRKASVDDIDVYVLWNVPVEAPGQTLAFRLFESGVEVIAPRIEGERAGD